MISTDHRRLSPASFVKHASDVAAFYGFEPLRTVERMVPNTSTTRGNHSFTTSVQVCAQAAKPNNPILAFYATPQPSHVPAHLPERDVAEFGLHVVGSQESLGEVVLIKTLATIVREWGLELARVRVNALGDRDSRLRFERELTSYLRKRQGDLDAACRKAITESPCLVYNCRNEACRAILADGPRAVNYLSEKSRAHFREVLEHIEGLGFPYELDDLLAGDEREPRVLFALDLVEGDATVVGAAGGRFDEHLRKLTGKKDGAAVSAGIYFRKKGADRGGFAALPKNAAPKVYFVQLGLKAKLRGLSVLDTLREAQVPVLQSFDARSLAPQLQTARERGVSHLIIMGQREALDGTVIVRATDTSAQTIVELQSLPRFLKNLRVG